MKYFNMGISDVNHLCYILPAPPTNELGTFQRNS